MKHLIFGFLFLLSLSSFCFAQTTAEEFIKKSNEYLSENKLPEAIAALNKAIALRPDDAELYLRRADLNFGVPDYEAAEQDVNQAARLKPDNKPTILTAAKILRNSRKCSEAKNLLDGFVAKQTAAGGDVFYARSHTKMCLGDWFGAYEDMFAASELTPPDAPLSNHYRTTLAGMLSKVGESDKAIEQLGKLIKFYHEKFMKQGVERGKFNPDHSLADVYRIRAGVYHAQKNETAEFADLAKSIEYNPLDFNYRIRAKIYADHEMYAEAAADYTQGLQNTLNPAIFLFERGEIYVEMKRFDEAVKDFTEAAKKDASFKDIAEQRIALIKQHSR